MKVAKMKANLFDKNLIRIISYFLISPGSRYRRKELKEKTGMNNVPLDTNLNKLCALKILKEKRNIYNLNLENQDMQLILNEIKKEYDEFHLSHAIFNIIVEISEKVAREKSIAQTILFGSYAKLIHTDKSDIDISIILKDSIKNVSSIEKKLRKETEKIGRRHSKIIELHFFHEKDMKQHDPLIKDIVRNGKPLW